MAVSRRSPPINRPARWGIVFSLVIALVVAQNWGWWYSIPAWIVGALLAYIFRDPARTIPAAPLGIVSPVDGRVVAVSTVHDAFLNRPAVRLTIETRWTDAHILRAPIEGEIMQQWYDAPYGEGVSRVVAANNSYRYAQWVQTDEGDDLVLGLRRNRWTWWVRCVAQPGERVGQGQCIGAIWVGAYVDVLVPPGSRIHATPGIRVQGGADILATLVHKS